LFNVDSIHYSKDQKTYKTLVEKRTVYGGGGIVPDLFVPLDTGRLTQSVTQLYLDGRFNNFVYKYYISHLKELEQYNSPSDFVTRYQNLEEPWTLLIKEALKDSIKLINVPEADKKNIQNQIKAYLARLKWRTQGYYQVANSYDADIEKAIEVLK
jgi:carboxyl-terminal processing protease